MRTVIEQALYFIAQNGWRASGENFFDALVAFLGRSLDVDYALVCELLPDGKTARTVGLYATGQLAPSLEYTLVDTPCENVLGGVMCYYPCGIQAMFPRDALLVDLDAEGYLGIPLLDSTGKAIGLIAVIAKRPFVAEEKQGHETVLQMVALRCAHEIENRKQEARLVKYRQLLHQTQDGVWFVSEDGRILDVNPGYCAMSGYTTQELLSMTVDEVAAETSTQDLARHAASVRRSGHDRFQSRHRRKDGTLYDVELTALHWTDHWGGHCGVLVRDITERQRAEEALRESEARYATLFQGAAEGILLADAETRQVAYANPSFCRMLGYSDEELRELTLGDIHPGEGDSARLQPAKLAEGATGFSVGTHPELDDVAGELLVSRELPCRRKDASIVFAEVTASRLVIGERPCFVGFYSEVTERKRAEAERERLAEQLRVSQKLEAIGSLAGGVAHDFNNLLSVILNFTSFAMEGLRDSAPVRADLHEVMMAGERAANLTRQLLAFSRKQVLKPETLNLGNIAAGVSKMLGRILGEDIEIVSAFAPDLGTVRADPGQMEQVLMNLAVNARDAMPTGGTLTIEATNVELGPETPLGACGLAAGHYVQLAVSDTGVGMDEYVRGRAFEPFFTTKATGKGTGLGLATVYGIVKQSGGEVQIESAPRSGTTFRVFLPRASDPRPVSAAPSAGPSPSTGHETILIVDDEAALRGITKRTLEHAGYAVLVAAGGEEALEISARFDGAIDLLLTDVVMPRMSGRAVAEALLKQRPQLKVIYMSGHTDDAVIRHGAHETGHGLLSKPFRRDELKGMIRRALDDGPPATTP